MALSETIYNAEVAAAKLSKRYVYLMAHGMCADKERLKIEEIEFLSSTLLKYENSSSLKYKNGELTQNCIKVILSKKNNYICKADQQEDENTINVLDVYENCLSEEDFIKYCNRLNSIINC